MMNVYCEVAGGQLARWPVDKLNVQKCERDGHCIHYDSHLRAAGALYDTMTFLMHCDTSLLHISLAECVVYSGN